MPGTKTTNEELKHCGNPVRKGKRVENGKTVYAVWCDSCKARGVGDTPQEALSAFSRVTSAPAVKGTPPVITDAPEGPDSLPAFVASHMPTLASNSAAFMERPALKRMIDRNVRYVMQQKNPAWNRVWESPEGRHSIVEALEDSFIMGASMPEMGSIVPYGQVVEFIPAVEAYEFALTEGARAPFRWINIEMIHEHDQYTSRRKNGNFEIEFTSILAKRGQVVAVAVYGELVKGNRSWVVGEIYETSRLLEKAKQHSPSYRAYLRNLNLYDVARSEGRVGVDGEGREYADVVVEAKDAGKYADRDRESFEKAEAAGELKSDGKGEYAEVEIPKKTGGTWKKKIYRRDIESPGTETKRIYREDIVNPYDGPDRPEMLRKTAGKSFLSRYVKVRNSKAAMDEMRSMADEDDASVSDVLDSALNSAFDQFDNTETSSAGRAEPPTDDDESIEAEYSVEDGPEPEDEGPELF
jgi:hypothetical protein